MKIQSDISFFIKNLEETVEVNSKMYFDIEKSLKQKALNVKDVDDLFYLTFTQFFDSLHSNMYSILILSRELQSNFHVEHSIGILFRNSLTTTMEILYLNLLALEGEGNVFSKALGQYHFQQVEYVKNRLLKTKKDVGELDKPIKEWFDDFMSRFPDLQSIVATHYTGGTFPTPSKQYKRLMSSKKFNYLGGIFDVWDYYSKYEHQGFLTTAIKKGTKKEMKLDRMLFSLQSSLMALYWCTRALGLKEYSETYLSLIDRIMDKTTNQII